MSALEFTILGSGSSTGVPRLGGKDGAGEWGECDPNNRKNRRTRCSLLVKRAKTTVLIDTSPDLREQLLAAKCGHVDAALITHAHADQTHGIDDLRALTFITGKRIDFYADAATLKQLTDRFSYCFAGVLGYTPILHGRIVPEPFAPFSVNGEGGQIPVTAFWQQHGPIRSLGYRFGPVAYSSDVNALDEEAFEALAGVEVWIVDALRYLPHPTHAHLDLALEWIAKVKPERAILTNMHIDLDFETLRRELPDGVEPAFDGLRFEIDG
jgi:phosphoribosyl 1,2-cyclic phosphate phosphodiesterase